jgi:hypothetical protein
MARRLALVATVAALTVALPAVARAATYCVNAPGCAGTNEPDLQAALTAAQASTGVSDTVQVGTNPGAPGPYTYTDGGNGANEVNIVGAGTSQTILARPASGNLTVLTVQGTGSEISHLTVQLPAVDGTGIVTSGSLDDVSVTTLDTTNHSQTGIAFEGAGVTEHWSGGSILMSSTSLNHQAVSTGNDGGVLTIRDVSVTAGIAFGSDLRNTVILRRVAIAAAAGYSASGDTITLDNVAYRATASPGIFIQVGTNTGQDMHLSLDHVSAFGNGIAGGVGLGLFSSFNGQTLTASVRNTIIHGFPVMLARSTAGSGVANVNLAFDETDIGATVEDDHTPGSGATTDGGGNVGGDPLWANPAAGNFALQPGSPAIDHGDPSGIAAGESTTDVLGAPRISGGRLDIGAVELQQPLVTPVVPDTTPPTFKTSKLPRKLTLKRLLAGITFTLVPSEPSSIDATLAGSARSVKLAAKNFNVTLAHRKLGLAAGRRRVTLKVKKRLLGRSRKFTLQLTLVLTDAAGNKATVKRAIKVR